MKLTRRSVLRSTAAALAAPALGALGGASLPGSAAAQARQWRHGLSLFGEPRYPAGFKHFDYVNPAAPQGGAVRQIAFGTFDNFNSVVAGVKGSLASGTRAVQRDADDAGARRGLDRIRLARGGGQLPGGSLLGHLPAARQRALA